MSARGKGMAGGQCDKGLRRCTDCNGVALPKHGFVTKATALPKLM